MRWLDDLVFKHYGVKLILSGNIPEFIENYMSTSLSKKPPKGIILILEVDDVVEGMGRFDTFSEGVGEIHNIWVNPGQRGNGYAIKLMNKLEEKAIEYGFTSLRLDTAKFNTPAQKLYRKIGYKEIPRYREITRNENENIIRYYEEKVYMEKIL